jgi:regulator of replication initiation timing|tara:strand:- start:422 stop:694 length:273 start_codon:yes stop_codon:yes gene_type:complete
VEDGLLIALLSAFGVKEIWSIIKKKMDQNEREGDKLDQLSLKIITELKEKIDSLELKIEELIIENTNLKIKVAKMEERLIKSAAHSKKRR